MDRQTFLIISIRTVLTSKEGQNGGNRDEMTVFLTQ
jgi:hypothetical protein